MKNNDVTSESSTPDTLMEHFRGKGLTSIILFTVAVHAVVLLGTSVPFLWRKVSGADPAKMTQEERVDQAVREATAKLRTIADTYNVSTQDISQRFSGSGARPATTPAKAPVAPEQVTPVTKEPEQPKSAIEKQLEVTKPGPTVPPVEVDPF